MTYQNKAGAVLIVLVALATVTAPVTAAVTVGGPGQQPAALGAGDGGNQPATTANGPVENQVGPPGALGANPTSLAETSDAEDDEPDQCERAREADRRRNESNESEPRPPVREECKKPVGDDSGDADDGGVGIQTSAFDTQNATQDLRSIGVNQTATGTIDTDDPYNASFRGYHEPVTFSGDAGQLININMRSNDDTYLYLLGPDGSVIAQDDDGGSGLNSEILLRLPSTGEYTIVATSYDSEDTFEYELSVAVPRDRDLRQTSVGGAVYSTIESDDPYNDTINGNYEPVTFAGEAGEDVSIRMAADGHSTHLLLVGPDGNVLAESENYGLAGIEATLPTTGNYTVLAGSNDDEFVEYQLSVLRDTHRDAESVSIGGAVAGTVDTNDRSNVSFGGYYESVTFDGSAGEEVAINLQSRDPHDKQLYLFAPDGSLVIGDHNTEEQALLAELPSSGTYTVVVASEEYGEQTFDYRLAVRQESHGDARSITFDDSVESSVDTGDPAKSAYDGHYEPVTFYGQTGQEVSISLGADGYYGQLRLVAPNGTVVAVAEDYDTSTIEAELPTTGTYTIVVGTDDYDTETFDYQLSMVTTSHPDLDTIPVNATRSSTLDTGDHQNDSYQGAYHEAVEFAGTAGETVAVSMRAADSDTYLHLIAPNGTVVAENDYGGEGSLITKTLTATGNYTIVATSDYYGTQTFDYELSVATQQNDLRSIGTNETKTGVIETSDPQDASFNGYYEPVSYQGTAGERVQFSMRSGEDTYLYLVAPNGTVIAQDDDGGEGVNSELSTVLPVDGTYTVVATSFDSTDTFNYRLTVQENPSSADLRSIDVNQTLEGAVGSDDPTAAEYTGHYEPVTVDGEAGEEVTITVRPSGYQWVDTYLYLVAPDGTVVAEADHGLNDRARLEATFPTTGTYTIVVTDDWEDESFEYELSVEPTSHRDVRSVSVGSAVRSTVDTGDPTTSQLGFYEPVTFSGEAGQEITVSRLVSGAYDTSNVRFTLLSPNGTVLTKSDYYYDGELKAVLPTTGTYTIRATVRYPDRSSGTYAFTITNDSHGDARSIGLNQGVLSTLDSGDPTADRFDGRYESVAFDGEAGQQVRFDVAAEGIQYADTYLYLVAPNGTVIAQNDYGSYGGSRIETTLPTDGTYQVVVGNDYGAGLFDYRLTATALAGTPASGTANVSVSKYELSTTDVAVNEPLNVTANVVNDGGVSGSTTVTLYANGTAISERVVTVPAGETVEVPFSVAFDSAGDRSVRVNDLNATTVSVEPGTASFQVRNLNAPSSASVGDDVVVSAEIVNTGNATATQTVSRSVEITDSASSGGGGGGQLRNVTLEPGESTWVSFTFSTDSSTATSYSATVETANDSATTSGEFTTQQFVCGVSTGDPHFVTFDGVAYDFQGVGEFTLARANGSDGDMVVQVRQVPVAGSTSVSITNATATVVDGHQVQIDASEPDPLSIDGQTVTVADGSSVAVGNGTVKRTGNTYTVVYPGPDGEANASDERLQVDVYGNRIDLKLCLDPARSEPVGGLLGSPNGNASDDFALRNGTVIGSDIDTDTLYGSYRDSWRVTNETTIFNYEDGRDPSFYYDPNYPEKIVTLADLNETVRERARELAIEAGLEPGTAAFRDAIIDYALTGDSSYFASATTSSTSNVTSDATTGNASFQIRSFNVPSTGTVGEDVVVSAELVNTGDATATQTVTFSYEEGAFAATGTRNVTLEPGESTYVSFRYGDDTTVAGTYSASISTANDSVSTSVDFTTQQFVCGVSTGDPHFVTFGGVSYDFQGVGEFTLARATNDTGDMVVQVRQVPVAGSTSVSITNATATVVDGHTVQIDASEADPVSVDGQTVTVADGGSVAVGNGTINRTGNTYTIVYPGPDGEADSSDERLQVDVYGNRIDLKLCLDPTRSRTVGGLLGSPDGNASNDFALRNGTVIGSDIDTDTLYGSYRESWRVTNDTTVFTYEDGRDPSFYYDPNYPEKIVTLSDLNESVRERARELAIEAGLEPGTPAFRDAIIDYALTGDSSYFASATTSSTSNVTSEAANPGALSSGVELVPANASATNGTTVTYEVVVTDATGGVGAYDLTVSVANASVGTVENATAGGNPDLSNVTVAGDGSSVRVEAALADTANTGPVTVATVTVRATAPGETDVGLAVTALGNESGTSYNVTLVDGAQLDVDAIGKLRDSYAGPPTDPDNDGVYEDINGDGEFNIIDVQALYTVHEDEVVQSNAAAFNVNGDTNEAGEPKVDIVDVQALYVESQ